MTIHCSIVLATVFVLTTGSAFCGEEEIMPPITVPQISVPTLKYMQDGLSGIVTKENQQTNVLPFIVQMHKRGSSYEVAVRVRHFGKLQRFTHAFLCDKEFSGMLLLPLSLRKSGEATNELSETTFLLPENVLKDSCLLLCVDLKESCTMPVPY